MPAVRIIPCLDVRDGLVVKGVRFTAHREVGDILDLALRYRDGGADELVFYDISASPEGRSVDTTWIYRVARELDIPFCVAGGITSVAAAESVLNAGADKISINTPALSRPELISELARRFGSQCVVVGIDSCERDGDYCVYRDTGTDQTRRESGRLTLEWLAEVQSRGAGEVVLNCMQSDGTRSGYDLRQLSEARRICHVPLIASGGAGRWEDFAAVFSIARVDGALAASVFHEQTLTIAELKGQLVASSLEVRI
ncbi:MAG: imidazole glycerol phosphate synthase subunit HisF [Gammaproteobacteria bacterium]|nr:imidazole glycerol phosphate synthase subunit HisF [Gammaproteobacteria bacterium]